VHHSNVERYNPGLVSENFWNLLCEESIHEWWLVWNELMLQEPKMPQLCIDDDGTDECESVELAWQIVGSSAFVDEMIFNRLKKLNWSAFLHWLGDKIKQPDRQHLRYEVIKSLFQTKNQSIGVQLSLTV
jgi:hypothetical protein